MGLCWYGKSHLVKHLIELINTNYPEHKVALTSMTHSADEGLQGLTKSPVTTLHSAMRWVPAFDVKTGNDFLRTPKKHALEGTNISLVRVAIKWRHIRIL